MLTNGIPSREDYKSLESEPLFQELLQHSRQFKEQCQSNGNFSKIYSMKWVADPFLQWSRRWEYVYVTQRLQQYSQHMHIPLNVVDAGSGFTFFPFYLQQTNLDLEIHCLDRDPTVGKALAETGDAVGFAPRFSVEDLESLSLDDNSVDAVYSISVIEHTPNPNKVVDEVRRVLKPGGQFICTFDISFEPRSLMNVSNVEKLVSRIAQSFDCPDDWTKIRFPELLNNSDIVTTGWIAETFSQALPWRYPVLVWIFDLFCGRPRGSLYRPMTFCCGTFIKKHDQG